MGMWQDTFENNKKHGIKVNAKRFETYSFFLFYYGYLLI